MADHAWDKAAVDFRPRGRSPLAALGRWLVGLFVIGATTLGTAFYLPLYRAHRTLTADHARVLEDRRRLEGELGHAREDLTSAQAARTALEAATAEAASKVLAERARLDGILATVRAKLHRLADTKILSSVDVRDDRIVVSFAPATVLGVEGLPPRTVAARLGLCDVATALSGVAGVAGAARGPGLDVVAYVADSSGSGAAPDATAAGVGALDVPTRLTSRVVESLESTCQVRTDVLSAIVRGRPSATGARLELASGSAR